MEKRIINRNLVLGSAAPQLVPAPERETREKEQIDIRRKNRVYENNRSKNSNVGIVYTIFMTAAIAVAFFACIQYIKLINTRNVNDFNINEKRAELAQLKEDNEELRIAIETSIDYAEIYRVAVYELGMVPAAGEQVITYNSGESEYVMQYLDVPTN